MVFKRARGHNRRDVAPETDQHGQEGLAGQSDGTHEPVHHEGSTGHVAGVLEHGQEEIRCRDDRDEGCHHLQAGAGAGGGCPPEPLSHRLAAWLESWRICHLVADESGVGKADKLFVQEGRKVFKEVCPAVANQISGQLEAKGIEPSALKRLWLHQANLSMNQLISKRVLGRDALPEEAPTILDEYANTSSAGSVIAFHKYREDFVSGDLGVLCSFGAGYSIGSVVLEKR